jgi:hypothetical protein
MVDHVLPSNYGNVNICVTCYELEIQEKSGIHSPYKGKNYWETEEFKSNVHS